MKKTIILLVIFELIWIGMGLQPRVQGHNLMNGRLGLGKSHELRNEDEQHNVLLLEKDQDTYEEQTMPLDGQTTSTRKQEQKQNTGSSLMPQNNYQGNHRLFGGDDSSTTGDGYGYHKLQQAQINRENLQRKSQVSSYAHYYGQRGHKMLRNRQHQSGQGNLRDQYSMQGQKMFNENKVEHEQEVKLSHQLKNRNQEHLQNDLEEPNNGERTYYVDDDLLRKGMAEEDTSSVKVRDYVDYDKELPRSDRAGVVSTPTTIGSYKERHQRLDHNKNDESRQNHDQTVDNVEGTDGDTDEETTSSQSVELHDPNKDADVLYNKGNNMYHQVNKETEMKGDDRLMGDLNEGNRVQGQGHLQRSDSMGSTSPNSPNTMVAGSSTAMTSDTSKMDANQFTNDDGNTIDDNDNNDNENDNDDNDNNDNDNNDNENNGQQYHLTAPSEDLTNTAQQAKNRQISESDTKQSVRSYKQHKWRNHQVQ